MSKIHILYTVHQKRKTNHKSILRHEAGFEAENLKTNRFSIILLGRSSLRVVQSHRTLLSTFI